MTHTIKISRLTEFDQEGGSLLYFTCKINNKKANLIIDSGASRTCIDENSYIRFIGLDKEKIIQKGIQTTGIGTTNMTSKLAQLNEIRINRLHIKECKVFITNLSNINTVFEGKIVIDGIFGNDFLEKYHAVINYGKQTISLKEL